MEKQMWNEGIGGPVGLPLCQRQRRYKPNKTEDKSGEEMTNQKQIRTISFFLKSGVPNVCQKFMLIHRDILFF